MDLSDPISTIVPSLDGPVLLVLARSTEPLTISQIAARVTRGSEPGVRKVLNRLAATGIVREWLVGRRGLYVANREHLAWPAVEILVHAKDGLCERIRAEVESWPVVPVSVELFGSIVSGTADLQSDIDVLLLRPDGVGSGDDAWGEALFRLIDLIQVWTGNAVDVLELSVSEFIDMGLRGEAVLRTPRRAVAGLDLGSNPPLPDVLARTMARGASSDPVLQALLDARLGTTP